MKLLGICLTLKEEKLKIDVDRVEVEKETKKMYKLGKNAHWIVFDCRRDINKAELNLIRKEDFSYIRRIIWVIDNGTKEQEEKLIKELRESIANELEERLEKIKKMKKVLME